MTDPYRAPGIDLEREDAEAQQGAPTLVRAGGALACAAGGLMAATAWQLQTMVWFRFAWQQGWVCAIGACGAVALLGGAGFSQARKWAIFPTVGATVLGALLMGAWVVYALLEGGLFTLVSAVGAGISAAAALVTGAGAGMARRVVAARNALYTDLE